MAFLEQLPLKAWQEILAELRAGPRILSWLVHLDDFIRNLNSRDPFIFTNGARAVQTNATSKTLEESDVTATELSYLSGTTSGVQGQFDSLYARINTQVAVTDIDDPSTELANYDGTAGRIMLAYQVGSDYNLHTLYAWDNAASGGANVPYVVAGSSGFWVAVSGRYVNFDVSVIGDINIPSDAKKIILGASGDMEAYYDGSEGNIDTSAIAASDLRITCGTSKTVVLENPVYLDIQFPISTGKVPAANFPTWEVLIGSNYAYSFDVNDHIQLQAVELDHWWAEGTDLLLHAHVTPKTGNATGSDRFVKIQVDIAYAEDGDTWAETTLSGEITIPDGTAALTEFVRTIDTLSLPSALIGLQSKAHLTRIAATGGTEYGDVVFITQIGFHAEKDTGGSRQAFVK